MTLLSSPIVNDALSLLCVAAIAERLQVVRRIGTAQAQWHNVIHRQCPDFPTGWTAAIWRVAFQNGYPLCLCATPVRCAFASATSLRGQPVGFWVSSAIVTNYGIPLFAVRHSPLSGLLVQLFTVSVRPIALLLGYLFSVLTAIAPIAFPLSIGMPAHILALVSSAASAALGLLSIGRAIMRRELVKWLRNLALSTGFVENRHRSISITDWAMPRLLQQRVAFSCPDFTTSLSKNKRQTGWQS